jgi:tetratricopeptide (TPR) repeat protein
VAAWLTAEAWSDAVGARTQQTVAPADIADLAAAVAGDPRRVIVVVGDAATGAALALARRAPAAWYPDPDGTDEPAATARALDDLLTAAGELSGRPLAVLDGPDPARALARLPALVRSPIHRRLAVIVPCSPAWAARLSRIAGAYPRRSMLVTVAGELPPSEAAPSQPCEERTPPAFPAVGASLLARAQEQLAAGQPQSARTRCAEAEALERAGGDLAGVLACQSLRARIEAALGDVGSAARIEQEVADGLLSLGDVAGAAGALTFVSDAALVCLDHPAAQAAMERVLSLWEEIGDVPGVASAHHRLAQLASQRADPAAAAGHYQQALAAFGEIGAPETVLDDLDAECAAARLAAEGQGQVRAEEAIAATTEEVIPPAALTRPRS